MRLRRGLPKRKRPRDPFDAMRPLRGVELRRAQVDYSRVSLSPIPEGVITRSAGGETGPQALGTSTFRMTRSLHSCLSANSSAPSPVHWKGSAGGLSICRCLRPNPPILSGGFDLERQTDLMSLTNLIGVLSVQFALTPNRGVRKRAT
jgi:hypothetical protein